MNIKKIAALAAAFTICVTASSCGKKNEQKTAEEYSKMFASQNHEYGAVMKDDKTSFAVPLTYDTEFIDKDAATVVANYFYAVQTKDTKLYRETTYGFYEDYLIKNVYADEKYTEKTFLEALYNGMKSVSGDNFKIQNIEITAYDDAETDVSSIKQAITDIGKKKLTEKDIQDMAKLTLDFRLEAGGETFTQNDETVYIIKSDDKWHLITS